MRTRQKRATLAALATSSALCIGTLVTPTWGASAATTTPAEPDASIVLGDPNDEQGLAQVEQGDGQTTPVTVGGQSARKTVGTGAQYMYFDIDDAIAHDSTYVACVRAEYYDEGTDGVSLQYDSQDSAFANSGTVIRANTNTWQTASFNIVDGRFANRVPFLPCRIVSRRPVHRDHL